MERSEQKRVVEALILGSPEPITAARVAEAVPYLRAARVRELIDELNAEYAEQGRAFQIWNVAGGYQLRTLPEFAEYLQRIQPTRPLRLSRAALETLAIVAYRQPVTRAEVEHIRGVDAGATLRSLLERRLVRIAGHREVPGRPMLYGTTRRFLEVFGLSRLEELPSLRDLEEVADEMGIERAPAEADVAAVEEQVEPAEAAAEPATEGGEGTAETTGPKAPPPARPRPDPADLLAGVQPAGKPH